MDDTGALLAADTCETIAAMIDECIDERSIGRPRGGVSDEAGGFIDDDEVAIFVENIEGDILGLGGSVLWRWQGEDDLVSCAHLSRRVIHDFAIERQVSLGDECLNARPRQMRDIVDYGVVFYAMVSRDSMVIFVEIFGKPSVYSVVFV